MHRSESFNWFVETLSEEFSDTVREWCYQKTTVEAEKTWETYTLVSSHYFVDLLRGLPLLRPGEVPTIDLYLLLNRISIAYTSIEQNHHSEAIRTIFELQGFVKKAGPSFIFNYAIFHFFTHPLLSGRLQGNEFAGVRRAVMKKIEDYSNSETFMKPFFCDSITHLIEKLSTLYS